MRPSNPKLSEAARHVVFPEGIKTTGWSAVREKGLELGIGFDLWQQGLGSICLGKLENGKYAATVGGIIMSIPRQVGKTYFVGALVVLLCILIPGLQVVWSSHHLRTTTKTFKSLKSLVNRKLVRPYLAVDRSNGVRSANGEQEIRFANGSVIMFGARAQGFGRGFDAIDIVVYDEAQILDEKAMEDIVPATNQTSQKATGALIFYMGTPPRPSDDGETFTAKRKAALTGENKACVYVEMSADRGAKRDDRAQWRKANPSYPTRTPEESMLRMAANLTDDDSWNREAYGIWPEAEEFTAVISADIWDWLEADGPGSGIAPAALAVDESHDGQISIAASWWTNDSGGLERIHVEEVWAGGDRNAALAWLIARTARNRSLPILIDSQSPASALLPLLAKQKRAGARAGTAGDMAKACSALTADVRTMPPVFSHGGQDAISVALATAKKRAIGKVGGWGWDRTDPNVSIAPLVALTLARHEGSTNKPVPRRQARRLR